MESYSTIDRILTDALIYAAGGKESDIDEMERMLLGVLASGDIDERHHQLIESAEAMGYAKRILPQRNAINMLLYADPKKRIGKMHIEVFKMLHAASMVHRKCYTRVLDFVNDLSDPVAMEAVRDYYQSIREESLSLLEHDKERNIRNARYFQDLQALTLEKFPGVAAIQISSPWDEFLLSGGTIPRTVISYKNGDYL